MTEPHSDASDRALERLDHEASRVVPLRDRVGRDSFGPRSARPAKRSKPSPRRWRRRLSRTGEVVRLADGASSAPSASARRGVGFSSPSRVPGERPFIVGGCVGARQAPATVCPRRRAARRRSAGRLRLQERSPRRHAPSGASSTRMPRMTRGGGVEGLAAPSAGAPPRAHRIRLPSAARAPPALGVCLAGDVPAARYRTVTARGAAGTPWSASPARPRACRLRAFKARCSSRMCFDLQGPGGR